MTTITAAYTKFLTVPGRRRRHRMNVLDGGQFRRLGSRFGEGEGRGFVASRGVNPVVGRQCDLRSVQARQRYGGDTGILLKYCGKLQLDDRAGTAVSVRCVHPGRTRRPHCGPCGGRGVQRVVLAGPHLLPVRRPGSGSRPSRDVAVDLCRCAGSRTGPDSMIGLPLAALPTFSSWRRARDSSSTCWRPLVTGHCSQRSCRSIPCSQSNC